MFKNKILYWTKLKGVKHTHLAKKCKVSEQTFSRWVNNVTQPNLIQGYIIAKELGIKMEDLIDKQKEDEDE